jgi:hypothetical protein
MEIRFVELLTQAPDEETALMLSVELPPWFQTKLREFLDALAPRQYYYRWSAMGDIRTREEAHHDSLRHQEALLKFAPKISAILESAP